MAREPDNIQKKFGPMQDKTMKNALAHKIAEQFPRMGGPRIRDLCAQIIQEVVEQHIRPRDSIRRGQVLWIAVDADDPPSRGKRIRDTNLIPVILDLSTPEDIQARLDHKSPGERLQRKAVRLCHQAYQQGALLSNCDLAEILTASDCRISELLVDYERLNGKVVPRRATLHDVGSGLTHKRIICWKHYVEGKAPDIVARETHHSLEAVDHYLGIFDRVRHCRLQGMSPKDTAYTLNCSLALVQEYLSIDAALETSHD